MADKTRRYAIAKEGGMFVGDGVSLAWPWNGVREVVELDPAKLPGRVKARVAGGYIVEVDDSPTPSEKVEKPRKLLTGAEAKAAMAEPAGPVTVVHHNRHTKQATETVLRDPRPTPEVDEQDEVPDAVVVDESDPTRPTITESYEIEVQDVPASTDPDVEVEPEVEPAEPAEAVAPPKPKTRGR